MSKLIIYCLKLFSYLCLVELAFSSILINHVFASDWKKYPSNPVFSQGIYNWNSYHVQNPSVVKLGNQYQMWYESNGGLGKRIGYAYSSNGVSWSQVPDEPILPDPIGSWEKETAEPFVLYDQRAASYKMWYTSFNSDHWSSGKDRFRLRSAIESDTSVWTKESGWSLYGTDGQWDSGGIYKGKSIIYHDGLFRLWYGGTDENPLGANAYWRIGYATSTDSAHWKKENQGKPVIEPISTEPKNANYPNVIYYGGFYHMWYGAGNSDDPTQINYAYSKDGITWIRPISQNPALTRTINSFDQNNIAPYTIFNDDGVLKMWYSGYSSDGHWRIGYATASASILYTENTPTPTATPTPTSTPTPTPTPTPTATPTPTPTPPTKQVIVIPGMTASWNADALINCKANDYKGGWTLIDTAHAIYDPLIESLNNNGWVPKLYTYDWRKQIQNNEADLKTYINSQLATDEKLDIVGHSMGGLLGRAYLEQEKNDNKAEKLMTVGSPHQGSVEAYPTWSAGEIPKGDSSWKFMLTLLVKRCAAVTHNDRLAIQQSFPAVRNLLPIFDYLINNQTGQSVPVVDMRATNDWLPSSSFRSPFFGTTVGTLTGIGQSTEISYRVGPRNRQDERLGNWADGKLTKTITTTDGDGTVLLSSGLVEGADNRTISANHTGLISSQDGINQILSFLRSSQPNLLTLTIAENKNKTVESPSASALYIIGYPASFWIMDPTHKITKDIDGLISFTNPHRGSYRILMAPKQKESLVIIMQQLPDGKVLYKEYHNKSRIPAIHVLNFDDRHPREDILQ